ncbi:MAG TPA: SDR family NAD(P)-dependent oxidoreductase, partial [Acidobacteriaceae bacterium]|nr:SDR family NAD(P)-dependent oxidoreductase [Acidobacteriaceae bacterium]
SLTLNIEDPAAIKSFAAKVAADFPSLNVLINNAGIMKPENLAADPIDLSTAESIITTNLLGPLRLTAALLPTLKKQPRATIVTVTSGLAFMPLAATPTYCATKAAIHSWTQSLRYQLRDTNIEVLELAPPYVQTELMGAQQAADPNAMPLGDFITETVTIFDNPPASGEILVQRVEPLRWAEKNGNFDQLFDRVNSMFAAH